MLGLLPFRHIVVADFEFNFGGHNSFEEASRSGERPHPVCMVAKELRSGQTWRLFEGKFPPTPPFPIGPDALIVAFYASAELGCFRALGWPMPANILDLFAEFRDRTNGLATPAGSGLVGALTYFGLDTLGVQEKDRLRLLILRGGPWSESERKEILEYCETDIVALEQLLPAMLPPRSNRGIDLPRALLRGRYMAAAAAMEWNGVPIDITILELLRNHWTDIQGDLIAAIDVDYGVYDGRTFKRDRFEILLNPERYSMASAGKRRAGFVPRYVPANGKELRDDRATARIASRFKRDAPQRSCRRTGCPQSHHTVGVSSQDQSQPTLEYPIYFWSQYMVARIDQATARLRCRLCRLVKPRIWDRRQTVR